MTWLPIRVGVTNPRPAGCSRTLPTTHSFNIFFLLLPTLWREPCLTLTMSHNLDAFNTIDYMICRSCNSPSFTWLANAFACPVCGETDYMYPMFADTPRHDLSASQPADKGHDQSLERQPEQGTLSLGERVQKRKRRPSSEDSDV